MSTEEPVANGAETSGGQNAQAAQDAENLLAELQGSTAPEAKDADGADEGNTNGSKPLEASKPKHTELQHKDKESTVRHDKRDRRDGGRGGRGGARGRGGFKHGRDNIKSDLTTQEVSDDPVAIRKQVEFYFSDSNLPMDKFLLGKVGGSKNDSVELGIIHSFKRMRHFQPLEAIVNALKDSTFLELTNDDTCVRRKEPLPEILNEGPDPQAIKVFEDKAMPRSVYVKGFGEEYPSTQFDIEAFFAPYGPTNAIRLRRAETKLFKGSVFAEFENEELAKKFLELDPAPKYKGKDLQIMSKKEYCDKKVDDIKSGKIMPNHRSFDRKSDGRDGRNRDPKRKRDDEDDRDWRERRDEDRKNGFKNDRRRGRDRDRDQGRREFKERHIEKDDRGVPVVKASGESDDKAKKDTGKAEALDKARAAVEAERKKEGQEAADGVEATEQDGNEDIKEGAANAVASSLQADAEAMSKKRAREDDDQEDERETKKPDIETGA